MSSVLWGIVSQSAGFSSKASFRNWLFSYHHQLVLPPALFFCLCQLFNESNFLKPGGELLKEAIWVINNFTEREKKKMFVYLVSQFPDPVPYTSPTEGSFGITEVPEQKQAPGSCTWHPLKEAFFKVCSYLRHLLALKELVRHLTVL